MKRSELFFASILIPMDIAMIVASFVLAYYIRIDLEVMPVFSDIGLTEYLRYSLYLIPAWIGLFALNGLYHIRSSRRFTDEFYRIFSASSTAMLILIVSIFLSRSLFFSRLILAFTWVSSLVMVSLGRGLIMVIRRFLFRYHIGVRNVLLIGDNSVSEKVIKTYYHDRKQGYEVKGVLSTEASHNRHGLKIIGTLEDLARLASKYDADEIVLTEANLKKSWLVDIIQVCADNHATFKYVPDTLALATANVTLGLLGSTPVMELQPIPLDGWGRIVKRILDIVLSFSAIILSSPFSIFAALGTLLTSRGPIIYRQKRVGRDGRTFDFYKFRSMYTDKCDFTQNGTKWTTKADEKTRISPFGAFLRKTNIDEIPQFFNVLKGDMSMVGPRPELPKFVEQFQKEIPEYFKRHRVKSGISGWAQVNGLKGDTSIRERVKYDIYYIENWSLWLDLLIVLKTIRLIVSEIFGGKTEYRSKTQPIEEKQPVKPAGQQAGD